MKQETNLSINPRTQAAYQEYLEAVTAKNDLVLKNIEIFEEYQALCEIVNERRKKLDIACRETKSGIGRISVSVVRTPVYKIDFLEEKLAHMYRNGRPILEDLIQTKKSVNRDVFQKLANDGILTEKDVEAAIEKINEIVRLRGLPEEITPL